VPPESAARSDLDGAALGIDDAAKLYDDTLAGALDDATVMHERQLFWALRSDLIDPTIGGMVERNAGCRPNVVSSSAFGIHLLCAG
jgi:hypothetical protein